MSEVSHSVMVRLRLSVEKTFYGGSVVLLSDSCFIDCKAVDDFTEDSVLFFAVVKNIEIIGEASAGR